MKVKFSQKFSHIVQNDADLCKRPIEFCFLLISMFE